MDKMDNRQHELSQQPLESTNTEHVSFDFSLLLSFHRSICASASRWSRVCRLRAFRSFESPASVMQSAIGLPASGWLAVPTRTPSYNNMQLMLVSRKNLAVCSRMELAIPTMISVASRFEITRRFVPRISGLVE